MCSCTDSDQPSSCERTALAVAKSTWPSRSQGENAKTVAAILNAADEITSNIVNYSGASSISVAVERAYDRLRLVFADDGCAYNPLSHVDPDTHAALEDRPIGGLGLVVVKRLVDRVSYAREDGRNLLTLIKRK